MRAGLAWLLVGDEGGHKVVAVAVKLIVVGILVVRHEMLRDPHENVEADRV